MCMSREFRLFCLALRRPQHAEDIAALRHELAGGPDWKCIIEGARRHRVAPLLLAGVQTCQSPHLPADAVTELRQEAFAAARRSLAQTAEIGRLSRIFGQAGIRVLALKGVVLSEQLYGDPAQRNPRDIDLLVDPQEFAEAGCAPRRGRVSTRRSDPVAAPSRRLSTLGQGRRIFPHYRRDRRRTAPSAE
jgi:hypothetical protein